MEINEAVRRLREKTGDSQQSFATRLRLSIRAIVNYEKDRTPSPKALAALAHLARKHREYALANQFWAALPKELQTIPILQGPFWFDVADARIVFQMLPKLDSPLPEAGQEIALSDPRRILGEYYRDLNSLISGDNPAVGGEPGEKIRKVAEGLDKVSKFFGQKVRVLPAQVKFASLKTRQELSSKATDQTKNESQEEK